MTGGGAPPPARPPAAPPPAPPPPADLLDADVVAELRHELRTPMNLVVGYCEGFVTFAGGS